MGVERLSAALADRYRIERELGAGGMATVYLAHDQRHNRRVAIKVLRPELAAVIGAERFLAEIQTTANLQHPHILPLFDSGHVTADTRMEDGGSRVEGDSSIRHHPSSILYYVMPFIEGESLRDRLAREKQLPIADAVRITSEVASALDYAHRHGVIHRDIKPENVMLHDGQALVADFGIALAVSSTAGTRMTETGMSLGTPHYMSPEQAMGEREITARSDVYALGCIAYEMLTGEPPFTGPTAQAIIARVMTEEPRAITGQRRSVPPHVEAAILTALEKLPADRYGTAAEFAAALGNPATTTTRAMASARRPPGSRLPWAIAGVLALLLAVAGWKLLGGSGPALSSAAPSRLAMLTPRQGGVTAGLIRQVSISPDGSTIYYVAVLNDGVSRTMRQRLDEETPEIATSIDAFVYGYRISRDGRWTFGINPRTNTTHVFPLAGGGVGRRLPEVSINWNSFVAWGPDGSLWQSRTGDREVISRLTPEGEVIAVPGETRDLVVADVINEHTLLAVRAFLGTASGALFLLDTRTGERREVISTPIVEARYAAGYLITVDGAGVMRAVEFDPKAGRITGTAVELATGVALTGSGVAQFEVARNGTVVYLPEEPRSLVLVDRAGAVRDATPERHNFHSPKFSRDGRRIAVDFSVAGERDVWVVEAASGLMSRVTFDKDGHDPSWVPNGDLTYITARNGVIGVMRVRPGSTAPPDSLFRGSTLGYTGEWLSDGSALLTVGNVTNPGSAEDIALLTKAGKGPLEPLVATAASEQYPSAAPDMKWFAYTTTQPGREEVFLRRLDGTGEQVQVSTNGGTEPIWSRDGREVFYRTTDEPAMMMAAEIAMDPTPRVVSRTPLFSVSGYAGATPHANYDVSPDGRQFVLVRTNPSARVMVIQNLRAMVEKLRGGN